MRLPTIPTIAFLCFTLYLPPIAYSATLNVGTGQTYATIQLAVNAAVAGDTVFVHNVGSPYVGFQVNGNSPFNHVSGTITNPILIQAESSAVVINSTGDTSGNNIRIDTVNYITIDGFEVSGATANGIFEVICTGCITKNVFVHNNALNGILTGFLVNFQLFGSHIQANGTNSGNHNVYISNSDTGYNGIHIYNNTINSANHGNNIQLNGDCTTLDPGGNSTGEITGFFIERNLIYGGPVHGIMLIDSSGGLIRNNIIYGNTGDQIQTGSQSGCITIGSSNNTIINNTFDPGTLSSFRVVQPATGIIWYNNLSVIDPGNGRDCVDDVTGNVCATGTDGILFYNVGLRITPTTAGGGTVFANYAGHNYALISGSPAINIGLATGGGYAAPVYDYLFNNRPVGGLWDVGAYEFNGSPVTPNVTPPTTPGTPSITNGTYQVSLTWIASTDTLEMLWYIVYRNSLPYAVAYTNSYIDTNVTPSTSYTYAIYALDTTWLLSIVSGSTTITTFGISGCMNADNTFRSVLTQNETATFEFTTDITPFTSPGPTTNAVIGLAPIQPLSYDAMGVQLLFSPSGVIQARNAGVYQADNVFAYTSGTAYHFRVDVNIPSHTYSVFVSTGGPETTIATNYAFRNSQSTATHLNWLGVTIDPSATGSVAVCNPAIGGIGIGGLQFISVITQSLATQVQTTVITDANGTGNPVMDRAKTPSLVGSRSLTLSDNGGLLVYTGSGAITVTVPTGLGAEFAATFIQDGTGLIQFVGSGLTLISRIGATHTIGLGSGAVIQCSASNVCHLWGDVQ